MFLHHYNDFYAQQSLKLAQSQFIFVIQCSHSVYASALHIAIDLVSLAVYITASV